MSTKTTTFISMDSYRREVPKDMTPEAIERQMAAFFRKGGKIQVLPDGASAMLDNRKNVQITLGSKRMELDI